LEKLSLSRIKANIEEHKLAFQKLQESAAFSINTGAFDSSAATYTR